MLPENSSFEDAVKNYLRNYMLFNFFFSKFEMYHNFVINYFEKCIAIL
jgi:hypothetical protein